MTNNALATDAIYFYKCLRFIFETNIEFMTTLYEVNLVGIHVAFLRPLSIHFECKDWRIVKKFRLVLIKEKKMRNILDLTCGAGKQQLPFMCVMNKI